MQLQLLKDFSISINKRVIIIFLIIIQSCGIRFFGGQGSVLIVLILFLVKGAVKDIKYRDINILLAITTFLILNTVANPSSELSKLVYQLGLVFEVYFFLLLYRNSSFDVGNDLFETLKIFFLHALFSYTLYLVARPLFMETKAFGYPYNTAFYLFYVTTATEGMCRNTGLLWEPGLLQLILNLLLFCNIKLNKKPIYSILIGITIISTFSTAGYIILMINVLYYVIKNITKPSHIILYTLFFFLAAPVLVIMQSNITEKVGGENTSGLIRYRDFTIGLELINEKPILGHGLFNNQYLASKPYVERIDSQLFSQEFMELAGDIGFTNGLLGIFCWYGVPMGLFLYYLLFLNKVFNKNVIEKIVFFLILTLSFFSEPITYTSLFLLFTFTTFVLKEHLSPPLSKRDRSNTLVNPYA